jgi:dTDP-4-dehydrorhamnose reductase
MVSRQPGLVGKNPVPPVSRILILGAKGRLGAALARKWAAHHEVTALARPAMDVSDLSALSQLLERTDFDVLVNGTGMTNVDQCEAARDEANMVNIDAPAIMARVAAAKAARFIHISTDYVFDGTKDGLYTEDDEAKPISHYGYTKLAGEHVTLAASPKHLAVRISWVFGPDKPSFIDMMLDRAMTYDHVEAIANKTSCPTYAEDVADWLEPFLSNALPGGLYQACNTGVCTWRDYGQHALDCAARIGLPLRSRVVHPIPLSALQNFASLRPPHTAMSTAKLAATTGITPRSWQDALEEYLNKKFTNASILPSST